jgi:hypothetical protein
MKRRLFGMPIAGAMCAVVFLGLAASASAVLPTYSNGFEANTNDWVANDGTLMRQANNYDNLADYADNVAPSVAGSSFHARLDRATCIRTNALAGAGDGAHCSGPFTGWGGISPPTFPVGGYTTQVDIYLDAAYAQANREPNNYSGNVDCLVPVPETTPTGATNPACKGTRFDYTSAINNNAGTHLRDFGFNVSTGLSTGILGTPCAGFTVTGQLVVNRANANPLIDNYEPQCVPESGWYTFKHTFFENGAGNLEALMEIIDVDTSAVIADWTIESHDFETGVYEADAIETVGCERYGWFSNQEIFGLPIDNASMTGCGTPPAPVGKILPTGTTCAQYRDGTTPPVLSQLLYTTTKTKSGSNINAVSPGVFFYYTKVLSGTANQVVSITEANTESAPPIPIQNGQVVLYDATTCKVVKATVTPGAVGEATVTLPSTGGNFIIGVKYSASDLKGKAAPASPPVTYTFGSTGVTPADAASIDLVQKA